MKLYIYRGLDDEIVPKDITHLIVDESVVIIKGFAFCSCAHLISAIMGDNVKRIENCAFFRCSSLRFIRLSNTLEFIGLLAFHHCQYLEAVFLPSTVKSIESGAFDRCRSLRLLILKCDIYLSIIRDTAIEKIAENAGVVYKLVDDIHFTDDSQRQVHNWLKHYMDESPFHKLCYDSSVTTEQINNYLNANDNNTKH